MRKHTSCSFTLSLFDGKWCGKCHTWKPFSDFNKHKNRPDGHQANCRECFKKRSKSFRESHPDYHEQYWRTHKAEFAMYDKRQYEKQKRRGIKSRQNSLEYCRAYREKNREKFEAKWRLRRILKAGNGGSHTEAEWKALCEQHGNICLRCKQAKRLTRDHVLPISLGGSDDISNIQPLCGSCNSIKHTQYVDYRAS